MTTPSPAAGAGAVTLADVLATPAFDGATVLAGSRGTDRTVERLTVMEVPDIHRWAKPHELLLTSAYPLRDDPAALVGLVRDLDDAGLAGLGIKLGRYLDALPPEVAEVADARGFPIVELPRGVTFDELLTEAFTVILDHQADRLARSERIHRAFLQTVLQGEGLDEIARDLADLLDGPTAITSPHGEILAGARLADHHLGDDPAILLDSTGRRARCGHREFDCTAVPILAGARHYGHVIALAEDRPPTDDLMALENAATVAALALTKQREIQAVEDKYRTDLMHDLLRGVEDADDARRRAASFGWDLDRPLVVLVVRVDHPPDALAPAGPSRRTPLAAGMHRLVTDRDPAAAVVAFSHEVVVLTRAFTDPDARAAASRFAAGLPREATRTADVAVSVGISRTIDDLAAVPTAYDQASRALEVGRRIEQHRSVRHFDELGAYRLLSLIDDRGELRTFAAEVLGELDEDTDEAADLRRTLQTWLDTGGNVAETARRLHFHYHTVRYRLAKLERLLGDLTADGQLRLDLQLALLARSLHPRDDRR